MYERAKAFIEKYKFDEIYNDFYTKKKAVISEFISILSEINKIDNSIPPFCPTCALKDKIRDGILNIRIFLKRKEMNLQKSNCDYKFKKGNGMGIVVTFKGNDYTNANLTNEIAHEMLKHNSKNANLFEIMPKEVEVKEPKTKDKNNDASDLSKFSDEDLFTALKTKNLSDKNLYKKGKLKKNYRALLEKMLS